MDVCGISSGVHEVWSRQKGCTCDIESGCLLPLHPFHHLHPSIISLFTPIIFTLLFSSFTLILFIIYNHPFHHLHPFFYIIYTYPFHHLYPFFYIIYTYHFHHLHPFFYIIYTHPFYHLHQYFSSFTPLPF